MFKVRNVAITAVACFAVTGVRADDCKKGSWTCKLKISDDLPKEVKDEVEKGKFDKYDMDVEADIKDGKRNEAGKVKVSDKNIVENKKKLLKTSIQLSNNPATKQKLEDELAKLKTEGVNLTEEQKKQKKLLILMIKSIGPAQKKEMEDALAKIEKEGVVVFEADLLQCKKGKLVGMEEYGTLTCEPSGMSVGIIILIVVAVLAATMIIIAAVVYFCVLKKAEEPSDTDDEDDLEEAENEDLEEAELSDTEHISEISFI